MQAEAEAEDDGAAVALMEEEEQQQQQEQPEEEIEAAMEEEEEDPRASNSSPSPTQSSSFQLALSPPAPSTPHAAAAAGAAFQVQQESPSAATVVAATIPAPTVIAPSPSPSAASPIASAAASPIASVASPAPAPTAPTIVRPATAEEMYVDWKEGIKFFALKAGVAVPELQKRRWTEYERKCAQDGVVKAVMESGSCGAEFLLLAQAGHVAATEARMRIFVHRCFAIIHGTLVHLAERFHLFEGQLLATPGAKSSLSEDSPYRPPPLDCRDVQRWIRFLPTQFQVVNEVGQCKCVDVSDNAAA